MEYPLTQILAQVEEAQIHIARIESAARAGDADQSYIEDQATVGKIILDAVFTNLKAVIG